MNTTDTTIQNGNVHRYVRTNIVIDANLLERAMELSGLATRRAVVDEALRLLVSKSAQNELLRLRGKLKWEGNLEEMRADRHWEHISAEETTDAEPMSG